MLVLSEPWLQKVNVRFESDTKAYQTKEVVQNKKIEKNKTKQREKTGERNKGRQITNQYLKSTFHRCVVLNHCTIKIKMSSNHNKTI